MNALRPQFGAAAVVGYKSTHDVLPGSVLEVQLSDEELRLARMWTRDLAGPFGFKPIELTGPEQDILSLVHFPAGYDKASLGFLGTREDGALDSLELWHPGKSPLNTMIQKLLGNATVSEKLPQDTAQEAGALLIELKTWQA